MEQESETDDQEEFLFFENKAKNNSLSVEFIEIKGTGREEM